MTHGETMAEAVAVDWGWIWAAISAVGALVSGFFAWRAYRRAEHVDWEILSRHHLMGTDMLGNKVGIEAAERLGITAGHTSWVLTNTGQALARNVDVVFDFDAKGLTYGLKHFPEIGPGQRVPLQEAGAKPWPELGQHPVYEAYADVTWGPMGGKRPTKHVKVIAVPIDHG